MDWLHECERSPQQDMNTSFHCIDLPSSFNTTWLLHTERPASCWNVQQRLQLPRKRTGSVWKQMRCDCFDWLLGPPSIFLQIFQFMIFPSVCGRRLHSGTKGSLGKIVAQSFGVGCHHERNTLWCVSGPLVRVHTASAALCKTVDCVFWSLICCWPSFAEWGVAS